MITTTVLKDNERLKSSLTAEQAVLMGTLKPSFQQQAALKMQGAALACQHTKMCKKSLAL